MRKSEIFNPNSSPIMVDLNKDRLAYTHKRDKELINSTGIGDLITLYNNLIMAKLEAIEVMVRYKERYNKFKTIDKMYKDVIEKDKNDTRLPNLQTTRMKLAGELRRLNYGIQNNLTEYYSFLRPFNEVLYSLPEKHLYDFVKGIIPATEYTIQNDDLSKHLLPEGAGIDFGTERWERDVYLDDSVKYRKRKSLIPIQRQIRKSNYTINMKNMNTIFSKITGVRLKRGRK